MEQSFIQNPNPKDCLERLVTDIQKRLGNTINMVSKITYLTRFIKTKW